MRYAIGLCLALAAAGGAHADPRADLEALRARIERLQRELAQTEGDRSEAADALRAAERAISAANRRMHDLGEQRTALGRTLALLRAEHRDLTRRVERERDAVGAVLRAAYVRGAAAPVSVLLSGQPPGEMARTLHYLGHVYRAHAELVERLRSDLQSLEAVRRQTQAQATALQRLEAEQAAQRAALVEQKAARAATLSRIAVDLRRQRREIGTLERNATRLTRLIQRLAEEIAARPPPRPARTDSDADGDFGDLKGRLRMPVQGELAHRFGSLRDGTSLAWNGIFITAQAGTPVRAVASGRVVFSDWLRGYGNLLILDHGDGYMSLYANAEALLREVGEQVRAGQPIAAAGASGGNPETGLYFEIRYRGRPLNPLAWVKTQ